MINLLYRPQNIPKQFTLKDRLRGIKETYNFVSRSVFAWKPAGWKINQQNLGKQHGKLHYLACHAPVSINKKWKSTYNIFYKKHFGTHLGSVRYLNKWSCHNWM